MDDWCIAAWWRYRVLFYVWFLIKYMFWIIDKKKYVYNNNFVFAVNITPTVELNALAMKRGEPAVYTFLDTVRPHGQQPLASGSIFRGMYNQRYHHQQPNNKAGPHQTSPVFRVRLTVGSIEVTGEGSTAQAAKHSAATNALLKLKVRLIWGFFWKEVNLGISKVIQISCENTRIFQGFW